MIGLHCLVKSEMSMSMSTSVMTWRHDQVHQCLCFYIKPPWFHTDRTTMGAFDIKTKICCL